MGIREQEKWDHRSRRSKRFGYQNCGKIIYVDYELIKLSMQNIEMITSCKRSRLRNDKSNLGVKY